MFAEMYVGSPIHFMYVNKRVHLLVGITLIQSQFNEILKFVYLQQGLKHRVGQSSFIILMYLVYGGPGEEVELIGFWRLGRDAYL
jgi:hypothetical protein